MHNSEKTTLTTIDHITINVHNLDASINWYLTSFNCKLLYQNKTLAILEFSNTKLILSLPSNQRPHLGFINKKASEFGEILKQSDLCQSTFISDPSGNPTELVLASYEDQINNS